MKTTGFHIRMIGYRPTISYFNNLRKEIPKVSPTVSLNLARRLKKRISDEIRAIPNSYDSSSHNTKVSLRKNPGMFFSYRKMGGTGRNGPGYQLIPKRAGGLDPMWVDRGTKPHQQPNNPKFAESGHPGSSPYHFMRKGYLKFQSEDVDKVIKETARRILQAHAREGIRIKDLERWGL